MNVIPPLSQEDLKAWTLCVWLFWGNVYIMWFVGKTGKNLLDTIARIASAIVFEIAVVHIIMILKKSDPHVLHMISSENIVYIDMFVYALWMIINGIVCSKYWELPDVICGLYSILTFSDRFDFVTQLELNEIQKFRWLLANFFFMAPITFAATAINFIVLEGFREYRNKTAMVLPSQSLDKEAHQIITFPVDDTFVGLISPLNDNPGIILV